MRKLKRLLYYSLSLLFICSIFFIGLLWYIKDKTFDLPELLVKKGKQLSNEYLNVDFSVGKISITPSKYNVSVNNLQLSKYDQQRKNLASDTEYINRPFFSVKQLDLQVASNTALLELYKSNLVLERAALNGLEYDLSAPLPDGKNKKIEIPWIPIENIIVSGLNLKTTFGDYNITDFKGVFSRKKENGKVSINFADGPFGSIATLSAGINLDSGNSSISLELFQHTFAPFSLIDYFANNHRLNILDGNGKLSLQFNGNILKRINDPFANLASLFNNDLSGFVFLNNFRFALFGIEGKLNLKASREPNKTWDYKLDSVLPEGFLKISGKWLGREDSLTDYSLNIRGEKIRLPDEFYESLNIKMPHMKSGYYDITGDLLGDINHIYGEGIISAKDWSVSDKKLEKTTINWVLNKDLSIDSKVTVKSFFGNVFANSTIWLQGEKKNTGKITGEVVGLDLGIIGEILNKPISGILETAFKADFKLDELTSSTYVFDLIMKNLSVFEIRPDLITAQLEGKGLNWNLVNPKVIFSKQGSIEFDGLINQKETNVIARVKNLSIDLLGVNPEIARGSVFMDGEIKGDTFNPTINGSLYGESFNIMGVDLCRIKSKLLINNKTLLLSPILLNPCNDSMIDGFASVDLITGALKAFNFSFHKLQLSALKALIPDSYEPESTEGILAGAVSYNNSKDQNAWSFHLDGRRLRVAGEFLDTVFAEGNVYGNQADIKNVFFRAFGGTVSISGQLLNRNHFYGFFEGNSLEYDKMNFLKKIIPDFSGELDFQGNVDWHDSKKTGYFTVFSKNMKTIERQLGNFGGNISIDEDKIIINKGEFDKLGIKLSGEMAWKGRRPYKADLQMEKVDFSFIPRAHGITAIDLGGLLIDGRCSVVGHADTKIPDNAEMHIDLLSIRKDNDVMETAKPVEVLFQNGAFEIRSFELKFKEGLIGCEGLFKPGEEVALSISGKNFSINTLGRLFGLPKADYDGNLSVDGRLFGKTEDLKMELNADVDDFTIANRKISKIKSIIEADKSKVLIKDFNIGMPSSSCSLIGAINLKDGFAIDTYDLNIKIPHGPIKDLVLYMPEVFKEASGTMGLDIDVSGTLEKPVISGDLRVNADNLQLKDVKKPFRNINILVSTEDKIVRLDKFELDMGRGKVQGEGSMSFDNAIGSVTARITGEKLDLDFKGLDLSNAGISINISGDIFNPELYAFIYLPRSRFTLNTDLFKTSDEPLKLPFKSFKYDLRFDVPRNFWVRSSFLNSEFAGKFGIKGDLNNFMLDGEINCIQGKLYFKQRQFRIEAGEIKFGGVDNSFDPYIYVKSEGKIQSTKIFLTLSGRLSQFTPQIYSTPPMSEGDILALLTLGRSLNSSADNESKGKFETEILDGLKNSYLSSLVGGTISEALNLDELFLTSVFDKSSGKSQPYIRVGKYISDKIFMAYEGTMDQNEKEVYIFEYRLPKGFIINLEFTEPEQSQKIGVRYDWKFR